MTHFEYFLPHILTMFNPSPISLMLCVDVKHYVYLLTYPVHEVTDTKIAGRNMAAPTVIFSRVSTSLFGKQDQVASAHVKVVVVLLPSYRQDP